MKKTFLISLFAAIALSACTNASKLEDKLAFELGKDPKQIKVTNVKVGMYETKFNAHINGKLHNCTALGGNPVSLGEALNPHCVPVGGKNTTRSCNAMQKAAGVCK